MKRTVRREIVVRCEVSIYGVILANLREYGYCQVFHVSLIITVCVVCIAAVSNKLK